MWFCPIFLSLMSGSASCMWRWTWAHDFKFHQLGLQLQCILIQGLPKLLLSATHLTNLHLYNISLSNYISPKAMMTGISVLTVLETLLLQFNPQFPPWPDNPVSASTNMHTPSCSHLLNVSRRVQIFSTPCDWYWCPSTKSLVYSITFFPQLSFSTSQFTKFFSYIPRLKAYDEAHIYFYNHDFFVKLQPLLHGGLKFQSSCSHSVWQLLSMISVAIVWIKGFRNLALASANNFIKIWKYLTR